MQINYVREGSNPWLPILIYLLPIAALIGFFVWMNRRAQGQMGAVMNIGKSRAKVHNAEKPQTTFGDVAGYEPVKEEIKEVVDFLKNPGKFKEIGARIPRGVLLVGPPGTGKTLIAARGRGRGRRAVRGDHRLRLHGDVRRRRRRPASATCSRPPASRRPRSSSSTRSTRSAASAAPVSAVGTTSASRR